jgi:Fic-DOC domain mobile mystery protein B
MNFENPFGATSLEEEEKALLIPKHITLMPELNAFEHANILMAEQWALRSRFALTISYMKKLHYKMFDQTWKWAGQFRKTEKNIGVDAYRIETDLKQLIDDILYQIENQSFDFDEIATRFHHRLVFIHAFPNGNGRHARLMTDLLLQRNRKERFTWGHSQLRSSDTYVRQDYIAALRLADAHDHSALLAFVRS